MVMKVLCFGTFYLDEDRIMKWKKALLWYLFTSSILTLLNGLFLPVIPIPSSNFLFANLMYWVYGKKHSILLAIVFISAISIMLLTVILAKKSMYKRRWFWIFFVITFLLYVLDLLRNCYFIFLAVTTLPNYGQIISETVYFLSIAGDLVFIVIAIICTLLLRKIKEHGGDTMQKKVRW